MKKIILGLLIAASAMAAQAQTRVVVRHRPHRTVVVARPEVVRPVVVARPAVIVARPVVVARPVRRRVVIVH